MNTIDQNNQIIGAFMGEDKRNLFAYHASYDLLMPVVEKITAIQHDGINPLIDFTIIVNAKANAVLLTPNTTHGPTSLELFGGKLIDSIYKACIHFITWHNENAK